MTTAVTERSCLNCGTELSGPFCANCGQRAIPAYPTVREAISDAWEEISGWDGKVARTSLTLLHKPGALTIETLEGRRARYVRPARLYLVASLTYFLLAAFSPAVGPAPGASIRGDQDVDVNLLDARTFEALSEEQRREALEKIDKVPGWLQPLVVSVMEDPAGFRGRVLSAMPKMIFALVPVFAGILALFYHRRRFMQHLIWALHLHATVFLVLAVTEAMKFTRLGWLAGLVGLAGTIFIAAYVLRALRAAYGGGWLMTAVKAAGIAVVYLIPWLAGMMVVLAWAAKFR